MSHPCVLLALILISAQALADDNPRHADLGPAVTAIKTLEQNWTHQESNDFYNAPQGSRLLPYDWFIHLERAEGTGKFLDPQNIRDLGYIPRKPDPHNPQGLPVGFIKDAPYEEGTEAVGLTCAACHTAQINVGNVAYLIDGGPSLGNFERLMKELAAALDATAGDQAKFDRFAAAIYPQGLSTGSKSLFRDKVRTVAGVRSEYNNRNLPKAPEDQFGPGRVDAFGAIFNEVSVTFLGIPQNVRPANAPVSYPCLWDTPQHDRVQWNGAAENKSSALGLVLLGTSEVGALGRNAGEVLGVFGDVEINATELLLPRRYPSTVHTVGLMGLEKSLKNLWSPLWPEDALGKIDSDLRTQGEALFKEHCASCHVSMVRTDKDRKVKALLVDVGTDSTMIGNFGRTANTGRLKGRLKTLLALDRFAEEEPVGVILKHVVERAILLPTLNPLGFQNALAQAANPANPLDAFDALNPGFRMTATIELGDKKLVGQFDSLVRDGANLTVKGGRFHVLDRTGSVTPGNIGGDVIDLRSLDSAKAAAARLERLIVPAMATASEAREQPRAVLTNARASVGYKARPLNGVWATAPYLHNGSVPSLAELLKPAAQRVKTFRVGGRDYDSGTLGFKEDSNQPLFDTTRPGNSNAGHEYGTGLNDQQRKQLLEYLKSL